MATFHKSSTTRLGCCFQACCRNLKKVGTSITGSAASAFQILGWSCTLDWGVCNPSLHKLLLSRNRSKIGFRLLQKLWYKVRAICKAPKIKIKKVIASPQEGSRACPNKKGFTSSELFTNVSYFHTVACTTGKGHITCHANMSEQIHVIATGEPLSQEFVSWNFDSCVAGCLWNLPVRNNESAIWLLHDCCLYLQILFAFWGAQSGSSFFGLAKATKYIEMLPFGS